jgi:hypothetical protein
MYTGQVLTVAGSVWVIRFAQRHLGRPTSFGLSLARGACGAFLVQGPVLVALALAPTRLDWSGDV